MLKKLFSFENEFTITKAAIIVGVFAFASKLLALVRDPLFTSKFGGDKIYVLDVYNSAFRIPDFIFSLFILGTLSVALIPIFVDIMILEKARAEKFANTVITLTMLTMAGIFLLLYVLAWPITKLLVPGFSQILLSQTVGLTRIIILSQIIFTLSNICTNILYSYKRFIMAGLAPILYNVGIIVGILFFYPHFGINGLGYGVLLGAVLHLLVQLPELTRASFRLYPAWQLKDPAIKKFFKLYIPRIFAVDLSVFGLLISTFIASTLKAGSIGIFTLALNILSIPVSIIALSVATAVFPALSEAFAKNDESVFLNMLKKTLIQIFYFMIPMTLLMLIFRAQGVRLYLGHGNFTWENTILTFNILGVLIFSVISQSLTPILSRAFFARQNTIIPVSINLGAMLVNLILAFWLKNGYGIIGVAAAFSIASILNCTVLFMLLRMRLTKTSLSPDALKQFDSELFTVFSKIILASIAMALSSYGSIYFLARFANTHTVIGLLLQVSLSGLFGLIVFFIASSGLKLRESQIILDYLKRTLGSMMSKYS